MALVAEEDGATARLDRLGGVLVGAIVDWMLEDCRTYPHAAPVDGS